MTRYQRLCVIALVLLIAALLQGAESHPDVEYAKPDGVSLKLDVLVPEGAGPHPAVILVHGGAFVEGHRQGDVKRFIEPFSNLGLTVFTIDYRLAPQYRYPAAVDDVEASIRWVRANAARYRTDASRITILGVSAGGYLASMAVARGKPGCEVSAVILFYPISDVPRTFDPNYTATRMRADRARFFGVSEATAENAAFLRSASPYHNLRPGMPPYLLLHGTADKRVDYPQSAAMCAKLNDTGSECELITVTNGGHGNWKDADWKQRMLSWLSAQLSTQASRRREPTK